MDMRPIFPPGRARPHVFQEKDEAPFTYFTEKNFEQIPRIRSLSSQTRFDIRVVSSVLPFKVNSYVIDQLIDWSDIPEDPIYQLTIPQRGMLSEAHFTRMADLLRNAAPREVIREAADSIRLELNPHPAEQTTLNVPKLDGVALPGLQHKYKETVLFFPPPGKPAIHTAHSASVGRSLSA